MKSGIREMNASVADQEAAKSRGRHIRRCMVRRLDASEKEKTGLVCANVYGLWWSEKTPGQDGMRYALFPFS